MSEKGHILLHRQLLDSEIFSNKTGLKIWIWLLFKASYKIRFVPLKIGKGETTVKLERGQLLFGRFKAEEALNIDGSTVYKWIHKMQDSGMITIESNSHSSIITIVNYDTYQMNDKEKEQPTNSQPTANQQPSDNRVTHISNVNKDNKDKKDKKDIPSLQDLRDGFINFATDYFRESKEGYDYNRLKLEADEFAHYWLDAKEGCKTQWEKKKRSDIKATARSRFTDRLGKIKTYDNKKAEPEQYTSPVVNITDPQKQREEQISSFKTMNDLIDYFYTWVAEGYNVEAMLDFMRENSSNWDSDRKNIYDVWVWGNKLKSSYRIIENYKSSEPRTGFVI